MTPNTSPPLKKITPTLTETRVNAIVGAVFAVVFAVAAILCAHFHVNDLVTLFLLIMMLFSLVACMDALQTRREIIRGIPLHKAKPPDKHSHYATATASIIGLAVLEIAVTGIFLWLLRHNSHPLAWIICGLVLAIFWGAWIGLYRLMVAKSSLVWSPRPDSSNSEAGSQRFDLPPLTPAALVKPVSNIVLQIGSCSIVGCIFISYSHGHILVAHALVWMAGALAAGLLLALIYLALIVFLTYLNNKGLRGGGPSNAVSQEDIWPSPPVSSGVPEEPLQ